MRPRALALAAALCAPLGGLVSSGCHGIYGLGEEPAGLDGQGGDSAGSSGSTDPGTSTSSTSTGAGGGAGGAGATGSGSGGGGSGGSAPGPCGGCVDDEDCGDAPGGLCGADGRCEVAAWTLSADARGVAEDFAVTAGFVAVVVDEGVKDLAAAPQDDNSLVIVDRATGEVRSVPLGATSLGSLGASPEGVVAFAPRADVGSGGLRLRRHLRGEAAVSVWPGAEELEAPLRGVRWDRGAPGGAAFLALEEATATTARLVLFGGGTPFSSCPASAPELPLGLAWSAEGADARLVIAEGPGASTMRIVARVTLAGDGCGSPAAATGDLVVLAGERVTAVAATDGLVGIVLTSGESTRALFVNGVGEPLGQAAMPGGHALSAAPGHFHVTREPGDGGLSRFPVASLGSPTPVPAFAGRLLLDVEWQAGALFGVALDSNGVAELICALE